MSWLVILIFIVNFQKELNPEDLVWKNRVLIYSGEEDFTTWFEGDIGKELSERRLLVFQFDGNALVNSNFMKPIRADEFLKKLKQGNKLKQNWVLIGLDGGTKKSGDLPPKPFEIFRIIDAMPMRQSEIRN